MMPLGNHSVATGKKILKEKFVGVFTVLLQELEKKDKKDLEFRDKEWLKRRWVYCNVASWSPDS